MIRIVALRHHRHIGLPLGLEAVIHAHQDDLLKSHVKGQLESHVGDRRALEQSSGRLGGEGGRAGVVRVHKDHLWVAPQLAASPPGDELRHVEISQVPLALVYHQRVDGDQIRGGESQLGEQQIDAVKSEREFPPEQPEISLFQTRTVTENETSLAPVKLAHVGNAALALPQPTIQQAGGLVAGPVVPPPVRAGQGAPERPGNGPLDRIDGSQ